MSAKDVTAAYGWSSPGSSIGSALMMSHLRAPSCQSMPITTPRLGCPVRSVTIEGWASPGKGEPSSWTATQRRSLDVWPIIWSRVRPRIRSAASLHSVI